MTSCVLLPTVTPPSYKHECPNNVIPCAHQAGHTDGHMALLHIKTNSLIVGDHCVGNYSANESAGFFQSWKCILDVTSGGNMTLQLDASLVVFL
ncbi:hypothetical protein CK203_088458 [Vitis vinifera]|uniref:Uncharacterized protein n=1 Tax=Vitis vinifera TaxID=29760 RepID=A0A438ELF9_VITVI|nr:hypothetical protein CK203_088458 [Vitis vinifera]